MYSSIIIVIMTLSLVFVIIALLRQDKASVRMRNEKSVASKKEYLQMISDLGIVTHLKAGKYLTGHAEISNPTENVSIGFSKDKAYILQKLMDNYVIYGTIEYDNVANILTEDATTIERRLTATRFLLLGLFAWAVKKKEKHEMFYTTIICPNGRFTNEIVFEFYGKNSATYSDDLKNEFIKRINEYDASKKNTKLS